MLNEEKKAIKMIEHIQECNTLIGYRVEDRTILAKALLNLIEKQQKETEELNKSDESKEQSSMKYYNLYKELVDKIKAKIEVLEKEEKEALKGTKGQDRYAIKQEYMYKRSGLQSLLEKE